MEGTGSLVRFGIDALLATPERWREWRRVGLVTNDAARLAADAAIPTRVALQHAGVPLVRLFGPEHGLAGTGDDGAAIADGLDPRTRLPVSSLYGTRMRPTRAQVADLDVVLFDIPDIGARCYTYAWTLYHELAACTEARVPVVVLDRPNPLGAVSASVEGPILDPSCRSFIGEDAIPLRHGCTLGELARLWRHERFPSLVLDVVEVQDWDATRAWPATALPWVPTSPAMPHFSSAVWYTGTCLGEATNLSVGRGTDTPFETIGAPWLDADAVARALEAWELPALRVATVSFTPAAGPWPYGGEACQGIHLQVAASDTAWAEAIARDIRPVRTGIALLNAIARRHADVFAWSAYVTAANPSGADHLARLIGRPDTADAIRSLEAAALRELVDAWTAASDWAARLQSAGVRRR